jgi:hypothetical protein
MTELETIARGFMVTIRQSANEPDTFRLSYVPRGLQQAREPGGAPKKVPEHRVVVRVQGDELPVQWEQAPDYSTLGQESFDEDARRRVKLLDAWLHSLRTLTSNIAKWAQDSEWVTKQIDKTMDDSEIGKYKVPVLLLQKETTRVLLEPVTRSGPKGESVVDLSVMPAYDDIASLYYYNDRWNLHYMARSQEPVGNIREAAAKQLTKASLRKVLEEMKEHAG